MIQDEEEPIDETWRGQVITVLQEPLIMRWDGDDSDDDEINDCAA